MTDLMDPCPHHTPNAGGSVASELHGICIFCWRDRAAALRQERDRALIHIAKLEAVADAARHVIRWREYEADPAAYKQEHEGWVPLLPWRQLHVTLVVLDQESDR